MAYATTQDLIDRYGNDEVAIAADHDDDGEMDTAAVELALDDASAEIDTILSHCYTVPLEDLSGKFAVVKTTCIDIAMERLRINAHTATEESEKRYKRMIERLYQICPRAAEIAKGGGNSQEGEGRGPAILTGGGRVFSRDSMKDF